MYNSNIIMLINNAAYVVSFNLRMFRIESLIYHSNNHSCTSYVSLPNIKYIVCWLPITSILESHRNKKSNAM